MAANLLVHINAQNQTARAFDEVKRGLDGIASTAVKVAAALGGALAFKNAIDTTRRMGDEIDSLRDNLGLTAQQASLLNFQARAMGTNAEEVSAAFGALNRKLIDQLPLLEKGESDFDKWGVAVRDASGDILPFQDVLQNVSKRLTELPAGFARSGAAMDLLGRSGRQLLDLMTATDGELAALNQEAQELGLVLSDAGVDSLEQFNRQMNRMGLAFDAIKLRLGMALLPLLRAFADGMRTAAGAVKSLGEALRTPLGILKEFGDRMASFSEAIRKEGFGPAIAKLAEDLIKKVGEILGAVGSWVGENLPKWVAAVRDLFAGMVDWIRTTGWPSLVTFVETNAPELARWISDSLPKWKDALGALYEGAKNWIATTGWPSLVSAIETVVPKLAEWITNSIPVWIGHLSDLIQSAVSWLIGTGIPDLVGALAEAIPKVGGWLLDAIGWMSHVGIPAASSTLFAIGGAVLKGIVEGLGDLKTKIWNWIKEAIPMAADIEAFLRSKFPGASSAPSPAHAPTSGFPGADGSGGGSAGGGGGGGGGKGWVPSSPAATLDDIYANYTNKYGVMPDYGTALELLNQGLTYRQVSQGIGLADGGIVKARPGGTLARIGEAGRDEAVIPLSGGMAGLGGISIGSIVINGDVDSRDRVDEVAEAVAGRLLELAGSMGPLRYR